jgi:hypothetical protein
MTLYRMSFLHTFPNNNPFLLQFTAYLWMTELIYVTTKALYLVHEQQTEFTSVTAGT